MATVNTIDIDGEQWDIEDTTARQTISDNEDSKGTVYTSEIVTVSNTSWINITFTIPFIKKGFYKIIQHEDSNPSASGIVQVFGNPAVQAGKTDGTSQAVLVQNLKVQTDTENYNFTVNIKRSGFGPVPTHFEFVKL